MRLLKAALLIIIIIFSTGFSHIITPQKILIEDKEVKNTEGYIIQDGKLYISEDALKRDFGFSIFHDRRPEEQIRIYDFPKILSEAKASLFESFGRYYDPKAPEEVVRLWAEGIKCRNGAFQFLAFNGLLREEFRSKMEGSSWVTGGSSPWVVSYEIKSHKPSKNVTKFDVIFNATTSAADQHIWRAELIVGREDEKWRIVELNGDPNIT